MSITLRSYKITDLNESVNNVTTTLDCFDAWISSNVGKPIPVLGRDLKTAIGTCENVERKDNLLVADVTVNAAEDTLAESEELVIAYTVSDYIYEFNSERTVTNAKLMHIFICRKPVE